MTDDRRPNYRQHAWSQVAAHIDLIEIALWIVLFAEAVLVWQLQKPWLVTDSRLYLELARNLTTHGFVSVTSTGLVPDAARAPGYPLFLNILMLRIGLSTATVIALQMMAYLISVALIAYRLIESRPHRLIFLGLTCAYVFPLFYAAALLSEALAVLCVAILVTVLARPKWNTGLLALIAGALVGTGAMIRTDILLTIVAVWVVIFWQSRGEPRRVVVGGAVAAGAATLIMLPYMLWNADTFGRLTPVPIGSTIGQSLYLATWEDQLELKDLLLISGGPVTPRAKATGFASEVQRIESIAGDRAPAVGVASSFPQRQLEVARSRAFGKAALSRLKAKPSEAIRHTLNATWRLFNTSRYPPMPRTPDIGLRLISFGVFAAGLAGGGLALLNWGRALPLAPALLAVIYLLPHLILHTEARYTAPLRLILLYYASFAVLQLLVISDRTYKTALSNSNKT